MLSDILDQYCFLLIRQSGRPFALFFGDQALKPALAVVFHIAADSLFITANDVGSFFFGAALENQPNGQVAIVQSVVV
ncbi:hypothetical protein GCM10008929_18010 [Alkalibacterium psychrotolerans]